MVFFNYSTMQMAAKIVYYGPGLCGKTTNLQYIYSRTSDGSRGEMVSLETETDRTLFFDLLPIDVGSIAGFKTRIQLYTVPGQVFYNTTRKLVLKGVDGVVFVADSQRPMLQANADSFKNMEENLTEMNLSAEETPLVLQYNKRDLDDICTVEEMEEALNWGSWPSFESSAITGDGVFETLKGISKLTLVNLKRRLAKGAPSGSPAAKPKAQVTVAEPPPAPVAVAAAAAAPAIAPSSIPARSTTPEAPKARASKSKSKSTSDVLAELEKIRTQTLRAPRPSPAAGGANGRREISQEIQLNLSPNDFARATRCLLNLQVEDSDAQVVDTIKDFAVDLGNLGHAQNVVVKLNIALKEK